MVEDNTPTLAGAALGVMLVAPLLLVGCRSPAELTPGAGEAAPVASTVSHPLDPLTADELKIAVDVAMASPELTEATRFGLVELAEPEKARVLVDEGPRRAFLVAFDWVNRKGFEIVVDLEERSVVSLESIPSRQPPSMYLTMRRIREVLDEDPRWNEGLARLGLADDDSVAVGPGGGPDEPILVVDGEMIVEPQAYLNNGPAGMAGIPFSMTVNLSAGTVVAFSDSGEPLQTSPGDIYAPASPRDTIKPMGISQASGASFSRDGSRVEWQNWSLHYGVNPRRGLEIYDVSLKDGDRLRKVLYRASVAEMITPYGDRGWQRWYPVDEGDLNLVNYSQRAAVPGEDAPPNVTFTPAVASDERGAVVEYERAVAIFERDGGILWRHWDRSRRARELVLSSVYTVDNYDYAISWIFHQDGTIEAEVLLSGIINYYRTDDVQDEASGLDGRKYGHVLVAPNVAGPIHQHFFSYRLDLDVDGLENTLVEHNSSLNTDDNPEGEWFHSTSTVLGSEKAAQRSLMVASSRNWHVVNESARNQLGQHPAYVLEPGRSAFSIAGALSPVRRKMGFVDHHIWATPYSSDEMYPAGIHTGVDFFGEGLPRWTEANRDLRNRDLVLWHTLAVTHLPRPEDWPIMPARRVGFRLTPFGFFDSNPTMDVVDPHPWE